MTADTANLAVSQTLEAGYAAYRRVHGRPRAMAWLRHALLREIEAQRLMDETSEQVNGDSHWRRLGEEARKQAEDVLAAEEALPRAAE